MQKITSQKKNNMQMYLNTKNKLLIKFKHFKFRSMHEIIINYDNTTNFSFDKIDARVNTIKESNALIYHGNAYVNNELFDAKYCIMQVDKITCAFIYLINDSKYIAIELLQDNKFAKDMLYEIDRIEIDFNKYTQMKSFYKKYFVHLVPFYKYLSSQFVRFDEIASNYPDNVIRDNFCITILNYIKIEVDKNNNSFIKLKVINDKQLFVL